MTPLTECLICRVYLERLRGEDPNFDPYAARRHLRGCGTPSIKLAKAVQSEEGKR